MKSRPHLPGLTPRTIAALLGYDPIFNSVPTDRARERLIAHFDLGATQPEFALGYHFDIVLRGPEATPANS